MEGLLIDCMNTRLERAGLNVVPLGCWRRKVGLWAGRYHSMSDYSWVRILAGEMGLSQYARVAGLQVVVVAMDWQNMQLVYAL